MPLSDVEQQARASRLANFAKTVGDCYREADPAQQEEIRQEVMRLISEFAISRDDLTPIDPEVFGYPVWPCEGKITARLQELIDLLLPPVDDPPPP